MQVYIEDTTAARSHAYRYLANYHIGHHSLDEAYYAAQECTKYNEVGYIIVLIEVCYKYLN